MGKLFSKGFLFFVMVMSHTAAIAAANDKTTKSIRAVTVSGETRALLSRYALRAYANADTTNRVQALLFTPRPHGTIPLPMVVYVPGCGELGELSRQFRQRVIFDRVTSPAFQAKYPCFLLALTPPCNATTLIGGMPGHPTAVQSSIREFVTAVCRMQTSPRVDPDRLYITGFSYGGCGAYALAQHFPTDFAAVAPIAALPPLPEYFKRDNPGNWWHFHNEGDYSKHGVDVSQIKEFAKLVNDAGGDFRIATYPDAGHDSWTKAWREDAVWDWMFSKSLKGQARKLTRKARDAEPVPLPLSSAFCSSSIPGRDAGHGPERVVDGLDATWYESRKPFTKADWWQVDLRTPMSGKFVFLTGDTRGGRRLTDAFVECSADGTRWTLAGSFSRKDGTCSLVSHKRIQYLRVRSASARPQTVFLRRLNVFKCGK